MTVNGKEAIELNGVSVKSWHKSDAYLVYFNGEEFFVPKSVARKNDDGSFFIQKWFYYKKIAKDAI
jgi:hypothetical protein